MGNKDILRGSFFNSAWKKSSKESVYEDYFAFYNALKSNYSSTIKDICRYDFSETVFKEMDEKISDKIYDVLSENEFHITPSNYDVLGYNPLFLIVSLENSYTRTLNLMVKRNNGLFESVDVPSFERENKILEEILLRENFVLTTSNVSLIKNSSVFLIASLKNDYKRTLSALDFSDIRVIYIGRKEAGEIIKAFFADRNPEYREVPVLLKNIIIRAVNEYYYEYGDYINDLVKNGKLPVCYLSDDYLPAATGYWNKYDSDANEYIFSSIDSYNSSKYCLEDEKLVLKSLAKEYPGLYSNCKNVEEVILVMHKHGFIKEEFTIMEMLAFQLYAAKKLNELGIVRRVSVFAYNYSMDAIGSHNPNIIDLRVHGDTTTVEDMVKVLNHEIEHARQFENIKKCNIAQDFDIDIYCKDYVLREIAGRDYYDKYHHHFSDEFDAQFKAVVSSSMFLDNDKRAKDLKLIKRRAKHYVASAESEIIGEEGYIRGHKRPEGKALNSFFENEMRELKQNNKGAFEKIVMNNPIINYEYKIDSSFERKTIAELVADFDKSSDKRDKGIYYNLIISRFCEYKEGKESVEENISEFMMVYNNSSYKGATKKILDFIESRIDLFSTEDYENRKYKKHFYECNKKKR